MRPPTNAFREALKVTASGACTVLLSTGLSCVVAVAIERSAHQLQYKLFPHWYDGKVKYAMGLPHLQHQKLDSEIDMEEKKVTFIATPTVVLNKQDHDEQDHVRHLEEFYPIEQDLAPIRKKEVLLESDNSQNKFQTYSEKIQEKAQLLSSERASKILLTTAMTG